MATVRVRHGRESIYARLARVIRYARKEEHLSDPGKASKHKVELGKGNAGAPAPDEQAFKSGKLKTPPTKTPRKKKLQTKDERASKRKIHDTFGEWGVSEQVAQLMAKMTRQDANNLVEKLVKSDSEYRRVSADKSTSVSAYNRAAHSRRRNQLTLFQLLAQPNSKESSAVKKAEDEAMGLIGALLESHKNHCDIKAQLKDSDYTNKSSPVFAKYKDADRANSKASAALMKRLMEGRDGETGLKVKVTKETKGTK